MKLLQSRPVVQVEWTPFLGVKHAAFARTHRLHLLLVPPYKHPLKQLSKIPLLLAHQYRKDVSAVYERAGCIHLRSL